MGNVCKIENCESIKKDKCLCMQCVTGYGLGGKCSNIGCDTCIKCGNNCNSCKKCVCTECFLGYSNNPKDPSNCIAGDNGFEDLSFKKYECNCDFIKFNFWIILLILLLLKLNH